MARRGLAAVLLLAGMAGAQVQAETHALLIGVSRPQSLPERLWLRGPTNDAELMRQTLVERGVDPQRIQVFADGPALAHARPTWQAVQDALQALKARVQRGDTVVLHLAGHSVQVPMRPGSAPEPDELDEVFLLTDTAPWDAARGTLPRGLYDDEIGAWMDALVDRGAQVLAVFDTCHAASLHRRTAGVRGARGVVREELGVRSRSTPPALGSTALPALAASQRLDGRVLAHAARAHESTPEERLPRGAATARVQGVFTFEVAQALKQGTADARGLRNALEQAYRRAQRETPVPLVRGEGRLGLPSPPGRADVGS